MLIVTPQDDELAKGFLGRWCLLNDFSDCDAGIIAMRRHSGRMGFEPRTTPVLHVLARLAGVDARHMELRHSMLPFMSFAMREDQQACGGGWSSAVVTHTGFLTPRSSAYLCPACMKEDLRSRSYSYWRRSHQLPSAFWCDKHPKERLHAVKVEKPFDRMPDYWLEAGLTEPEDLPEEVRASAEFTSFGDACRAMLEAEVSRNVTHVRRALCDQAQSLGLTTKRGPFDLTKRARPSDFAQRKVPASLRRKLFPSLELKARGTFYNEIDDAVRSGNYSSMPLGTAFAVSLLFPSVSSAFLSMDAASRRPPSKVLRAAIDQLFIQENGSLPAIASAMNLSVTRVTEMVISHRLLIQKAIDGHATGFALKAFYDADTLSLAEACSRHGANLRLAERALWLKGVPKSRRVSALAE